MRALAVWTWFAGGLALLAPGVTRVVAADSALGLADLAAYRAALTEHKEATAPPVPVTFADLWRRPDTYRGRRVQVEGRVVRRFRQGAVGTFPPLLEVWIVSPSGDPLCLVFPASESRPLDPSTSIRFAGTYLRTIRYEGGDVPRLAPLIVGPRQPEPIAVHGTPRRPSSSALDWWIGVGAAIVVALALAWQHARKPVRRPLRRDEEGPPLFASSPPPSSESGNEGGQDGSHADAG